MMKNIKYYKQAIIAASFSLILLSSCNDDFMQKSPVTEPTTESAFETYDNFKTYSWDLYTVLTKYDDKLYNNDIAAGYLFNGTSGGESKWVYQTVTPLNSSGEWKFDYIRKVNVMLNQIESSKMTDAEQKHWRSVGYFFRAYRYTEMLATFGDINWLENEVKETDDEILYGKRTSRAQVAENILRDLRYAEENIGNYKDTEGKQSVDVHVVRALQSRFGLQEGTWRKYHKLDDPETYLKASVSASEKLMGAGFSIHENWGELFTSKELAGNTEMIMYREYNTGYTQHNLTRMARTSSVTTEMTKKTANGYLCSDGKTIWNSDEFEGDQGENAVFKEFRNRDKRLWYVVTPPYKVSAPGGNASSWKYLKEGDAGTSGKITVDAQDEKDFREHLDYFNANMQGATGKSLPMSNWAGYLVAEMPHFRNFNMGQAFLASEAGYMCWMFYDEHVTPQQWENGVSDCPVFRLGEVLMNYAEAKWELGEFNQTVANQTINKLRKRAGIVDMVVASVDADFDPTRDSGTISYQREDGATQTIQTGYAVDPILWEIRRERRNELMAQGFGQTDLRRWKKGMYVNEVQLGAWVKNEEYNNVLTIYGYKSKEGSLNKEGYVKYHRDPVVDAGKGWLNHYYLNPLPITELVLNANLEQNDGYPRE